jgi:hypothetical protein
MDCESSAAVLTAAHLNASNRSAHKPQNPANPAWWYGRVAHSRACVCVLRAAHCTDDAQSAQGTPTLFVCLFVCLLVCGSGTRRANRRSSRARTRPTGAPPPPAYTHARTHTRGWFQVVWSISVYAGTGGACPAAYRAQQRSTVVATLHRRKQTNKRRTAKR